MLMVILFMAGVLFLEEEMLLRRMQIQKVLILVIEDMELIAGYKLVTTNERLCWFGIYNKVFELEITGKIERNLTVKRMHLSGMLVVRDELLSTYYQRHMDLTVNRGVFHWVSDNLASKFKIESQSTVICNCGFN
jgi:hypothetical protein